ncbi:hypothetical protein PENTCL1PPCAC_23165, partial [Pristionchus entomophagus]
CHCRMARRPLMDLIVAADDAGGIGKGGKIPWVLHKDMAHFKEKTTTVNDSSKRNAVVMGRKCWESIPLKYRPLPGRLNIVVSRVMPESTTNDVLIRNDLNQLMDELQSIMEKGEIERVWNIGGGEIYEWALQRGLVRTIEITKIRNNFGANVFLPQINWENFKEVSVSEDQEEKNIQFTFHTFERL